MQNIHGFSSWSERQKLSRFELFTFFFLHVCDKVCNALADRNVVSFTSFLVSYTWFSPGLWIGLDPFKNPAALWVSVIRAQPDWGFGFTSSWNAN